MSFLAVNVLIVLTNSMVVKPKGATLPTPWRWRHYSPLKHSDLLVTVLNIPEDLNLHQHHFQVHLSCICQGADKSLARPTSQYVLFDGENISYI